MDFSDQGLLTCTNESVPFFSLQGHTCPGKVVYIHDGDTVRIAIRMNNGELKKFQCRMLGYDSPELKSKDANAWRATNILARLVLSEDIPLDVEVLHTKHDWCEIFALNRKVLLVEFHQDDKYGRKLVRLTDRDGNCLNDQVMEHSFNVAYDGGKKK